MGMPTEKIIINYFAIGKSKRKNFLKLKNILDIKNQIVFKHNMPSDRYCYYFFKA